MKRPKLKRKDKPSEGAPRWVVVEANDCRVPKYLVNGQAAGFEKALALTLAARAHPGQTEYTVVEVDVFRWARALGEPISAQKALQDFVPKGEGEE